MVFCFVSFVCFCLFGFLCFVHLVFFFPLSPFPPQRASFEERQVELDAYVSGTKYVVQKRRLRLDFEQFLAARSVCPPPLATAACFAKAAPIDVVRFMHNMHHRDQAGRTHVHKFDCPHFGCEIAGARVISPLELWRAMSGSCALNFGTWAFKST